MHNAAEVIIIIGKPGFFKQLIDIAGKNYAVLKYFVYWCDLERHEKLHVVIIKMDGWL